MAFTIACRLDNPRSSSNREVVKESLGLWQLGAGSKCPAWCKDVEFEPVEGNNDCSRDSVRLFGDENGDIEASRSMCGVWSPGVDRIEARRFRIEVTRVGGSGKG